MNMGVEFEDVTTGTGSVPPESTNADTADDGTRRRTWSIRIADPIGWYEANRPVEHVAPSLPTAFTTIGSEDVPQSLTALPIVMPDDADASSPIDAAIASNVSAASPSDGDDASVTDSDGIPFVPGETVWDMETGRHLTVDHTGAVVLSDDGQPMVSVYEDHGSETDEPPFDMPPTSLTHRNPDPDAEARAQAFMAEVRARIASRKGMTEDTVEANRADVADAKNAETNETGTANATGTTGTVDAEDIANDANDATAGASADADAAGTAKGTNETGEQDASKTGTVTNPDNTASLAASALSLVLSSLVPDDGSAIASGAAAEVETDPDSDDANCVLYAGFVTNESMTATEVLDMLGGPSHGVIVRPMTRGGGYTLSFIRKSGRFAEDADALVAGPEEVGLPIDAIGERGASGFGMAGVRGGVPVDVRDASVTAAPKADRTVAISVDTTGFEPGDDEVLQVALYGDDGRVVYARRFGTERKEAWPDAQRVNGISPESVEGLPTFADCVTGDDALAAILAEADVIVAHNVPFILGFLADAGVGLDGKLFGDTARCFRDYLYDKRMFDVRKTLAEAARVLDVGLSAHPDTPEKAWAAYAVWKALSAAGYGRLSTLEQMREEYRRSHDYRRKRNGRKYAR